MKLDLPAVLVVRARMGDGIVPGPAVYSVLRCVASRAGEPAERCSTESGLALIAGENVDCYEDAPRYWSMARAAGVRALIAISVSVPLQRRLLRAGIVPLHLVSRDDLRTISVGDVLTVGNFKEMLERGSEVWLYNRAISKIYRLTPPLAALKSPGEPAPPQFRAPTGALTRLH